MAKPNVIVKLGNGNLGRVAATSDGVAGLILTGKAVADKLELNKVYPISSTRDLINMGVTKEDNYLVNKEVREFYAQVGEGSELYLIVVSDTTTLEDMCDSADGSPLCKLIEAGGGRIRLFGCNKLPAVGYTPVLTGGIDEDAVKAATKAQQTGNSFVTTQRPFRGFIPAASWTGVADKGLFKPRESSTNRVGFVLASDDETNHTAAIGQVLGRAAKINVHQSIGRVADGAVAPDGWMTDGSNFMENQGKADLLHDAGYIFYTNYPTKNGCYFNGDPTAAPLSDDYSAIRLGRTIDKAQIVCYTTYIDLILDNVEVDENGNIAVGACRSFEGMLENALGSQMQGEISSLSVSIDPNQNILSTETMDVNVEIVPRGVLYTININLAFSNPALKTE